MIKMGGILVIAVATLAMGSLPATAQSVAAPTPSRQLAADDLVFHRLQTLVLVHFHNTPLNQAFKALAAAAGVNLFVDWRKMASAGVTRTTLVSLNFRGPVFVRAALSYVLKQFSA